MSGTRRMLTAPQSTPEPPKADIFFRNLKGQIPLSALTAELDVPSNHWDKEGYRGQKKNTADLKRLACCQNKSMWPWLVGGTLIVAAKRTGFTLEFLVLVVAFLNVALMDWQSRQRKLMQRNFRRLHAYCSILIVATTWFGSAR